MNRRDALRTIAVGTAAAIVDPSRLLAAPAGPTEADIFALYSARVPTPAFGRWIMGPFGRWIMSPSVFAEIVPVDERIQFTYTVPLESI